MVRSRASHRLMVAVAPISVGVSLREPGTGGNTRNMSFPLPRPAGVGTVAAAPSRARRHAACSRQANMNLSAVFAGLLLLGAACDVGSILEDGAPAVGVVTSPHHAA